jgi:hypothetical protein
MDPELQWEYWVGAIVAVGALGTAAYGVVEAFGKALVIKTWGLPFVGWPCARVVVREYATALKFTYGEHYEKILIQEYRNGRSTGRAPETIRNGVKLALPLMDPAEAQKIVEGAWGLPTASSQQLVAALQAPPTGKAPTAAAQNAAVLAGRFGLAVDSRIAAAFTLAEERYQAFARLWAGFAAISLALLFNAGMKGLDCGALLSGGRCSMGEADGGFPWITATLIGAAAVPLAPIAKDLSGALTDALKAWRQVTSPGKS